MNQAYNGKKINRLSNYLNNKKISNLFAIAWIVTSILACYSVEGVAWIIAPLFALPLLLGAILSVFNIKFKKIILLILEFITCIFTIILYFEFIPNLTYSMQSILSLIIPIFVAIVCLIKIILSCLYLKIK